MSTNELIKALRDWADRVPMPGRKGLLTETADRLELLDERVAILSEAKTGTWLKDGVYGETALGKWKCSKCGFPSCAFDYPKEKYCSRCGAKMEGTRND